MLFLKFDFPTVPVTGNIQLRLYLSMVICSTMPQILKLEVVAPQILLLHPDSGSKVAHPSQTNSLPPPELILAQYFVSLQKG